MDRLFQYAQFFSYLNESCNTLVKVFLFVACRNLYTDTCLFLWNNRVVESRYVNTFLLHAGCVDLG